MFGPFGCRGGDGGAPRAERRKRQSTPVESKSHWQGLPQVALSEAAVSARGWPDARSTTQSSIPVSRRTAYERCEPSGENSGQPRVVPRGASMRMPSSPAPASLATASRRRMVSAAISGARQGPLFRGSIR